MKVVVMAAGKGLRMLPITETIPKVLIEINGKPFLYYVLKSLQKAGYNEFGLIVGYRKDMVAKFLMKQGIEAELIEQKEQLGTAHAIKQAKRFVGKENFIALGGDNIWSINDLARMNIKDNLNYIAGYKVNNPEKYGVLVVENDNLVRIHEKPKEFVGNFINTGLYKFTPEIFDAIGKIGLSQRGEYELTDAISLLAKEGKVKVIKIQDFWKDLGKLDDIPGVEKFMKEHWR
jgi:dTDP-glucose pyrophosphorylase